MTDTDYAEKTGLALHVPDSSWWAQAKYTTDVDQHEAGLTWNDALRGNVGEGNGSAS